MPDAYGELAAGIAAARERFLAAGEAVAGTVREQILNSWRRSRFSSVDVDRIDPPYRADIDYDNRLDRRSGDRALQRKLDQVSLAPGFSYAEEFVGTNGIGTALEDQSSAWVYGPEHFSARLQALSCAGAVIRNPLRGRVEGVIDLTCWRGEASPLMRVLAQEAARDISQHLVELESERERALLQDFIAACRRNNNPILSLNDDLVISNSRGVKLLDPGDHAALQERAAELLRSATDTTADLRLPSGRSVRLQC